MFKRSPIIFFIIAILALATVGVAQANPATHQPKLMLQTNTIPQPLIAVSPVNSQVVWASGRGGTFVRTIDGGATWQAGVVPGAETLQFRDVQGVSENVAYLMSIGNNTTDFRIYKTINGGNTWSLQFTNHLDGAFYDCFAFWTSTRGIVHSDSVNGQFPDRRTTDGMNWIDISQNLPTALPDEASFAASGTCIATQGTSNAWIATGGSTIARILATRDGGDTWNAYDTPLVSSPSAGGFSVAFRDSQHGIVGGGDLASNGNADAAISSDGGKNWTLTNPPPVTGAIFGLSYVHPAANGIAPNYVGRMVVVTANTGGAAWTPDEGNHWFSLPLTGFWSVAFASPQAGWLVGTTGGTNPKGKIEKISF